MLTFRIQFKNVFKMKKQIIVIFGDQGVGKTNLAKQITFNKDCIVSIDGKHWRDDLKQNPTCEWLIVDDGTPTEQLHDLFTTDIVSIRKLYETKPSDYDVPNVIITSNDVIWWKAYEKDIKSGSVRVSPNKTIQFIKISKRY